MAQAREGAERTVVSTKVLGEGGGMEQRELLLQRRSRYHINRLDLKHIALAGDHFVEHRIDEKPDEQP
jgi:hypothetical protein